MNVNLLSSTHRSVSRIMSIFFTHPLHKLFLKSLVLLRAVEKWCIDMLIGVCSLPVFTPDPSAFQHSRPLFTRSTTRTRNEPRTHRQHDPRAVDRSVTGLSPWCTEECATPDPPGRPYGCCFYGSLVIWNMCRHVSFLF